MYDVIIAGAGAAGSTAARTLAEAGKQVLMLEKRNHVGGNCYDEKDPYGVLIHLYGPHIFHTDKRRIDSGSIQFEYTASCFWGRCRSDRKETDRQLRTGNEGACFGIASYIRSGSETNRRVCL